MKRKGTTSHVDHANTFYQIPADGNGLPMVFLHGYGQSRTGWQSTPDGREGWADIFLKKGHPVFLVDQPRRGAAGSTVEMTKDALDADGTKYRPGEQAWYTHFRIGRVAPERYDGSQFPAGDAAQTQFFCQMTPNTGRAVEPGGAPEIGSDEYKKFLAAKTPMLFLFGDYIDNGPQDIMSTGFWQTVLKQCRDFAEQYVKDGGVADVIHLPKHNIHGNSHFMFQEMNNKEIADLISEWITKHN